MRSYIRCLRQTGSIFHAKTAWRTSVRQQVVGKACKHSKVRVRSEDEMTATITHIWRLWRVITRSEQNLHLCTKRYLAQRLLKYCWFEMLATHGMLLLMLPPILILYRLQSPEERSYFVMTRRKHRSTEDPTFSNIVTLGLEDQNAHLPLSRTRETSKQNHPTSYRHPRGTPAIGVLMEEYKYLKL